ncbi:hypothetical protein [Phosphitispora sp. TUW77]|uniref:hypothetical protein n=1 Tax=Phosphitispora sp. TUW77 TaxID=3152361 RepID=UPI003AB811FA
MMVSNIKNRIVFPRIPLKLSLPSGYPDVGKISNISIDPEITDFRHISGEIEIKGYYQITVSYFQARNEEDLDPPELKELENDNFFCHLKLQADGLFAEEEDNCSGKAGIGTELYTVHYSKPFHTYVDINLIDRARQFRPGMVVERVDLVSDEPGSLSGELVLGLVNRTRRYRW